MRRSKIAIPAMLACLALTSCDDDTPPPAPQPAPAAPAPKPAKVEEAAPEAEVVEYSYNPAGKRDPFRTVLDEMLPVAESPVLDTDCGPLCAWELDQLRVVAVVSGQASPVAMVEDPAGKGHLLRRGMSIGKRSGKVTDIRRDRLVVTELLRGSKGQVTPAKTEMPLRSKAPAGEKLEVDLTPQNSDD